MGGTFKREGIYVCVWLIHVDIWQKIKVLVAQLCLTLYHPMTVAHQAPLSMEFSRQKYWSGLSCPPPGDFPNPGIEPLFSTLAGRFFTSESSGKTQLYLNRNTKERCGKAADNGNLKLSRSINCILGLTDSTEGSFWGLALLIRLGYSCILVIS